MAELQDSMVQNMTKFETGMDKVMQTVEAATTKPSGQEKRGGRASDRG